MEKMNSNQEKNVMLNILEFIDDICKKNDIEYSLGGGTLLGAVRHGGFIPWDDDADIMLTRDNYNKLTMILNNTDNTIFGFMNESYDSYYYTFSKVYDKRTRLKKLSPVEEVIADLGVYVDIFPIDKIPDDDAETNVFFKKLTKKFKNMYSTIPGYYTYSENWIKRIIKPIVFSPILIKGKLSRKTTRQLQHEMLELMQEYNTSDAHFAGYLYSEYGKKEKTNIKVFKDYKDIKFEDLWLRSINNTDNYLSGHYGNYMELPAKNNRNGKHIFESYWK